LFGFGRSFSKAAGFPCETTISFSFCGLNVLRWRSCCASGIVDMAGTKILIHLCSEVNVASSLQPNIRGSGSIRQQQLFENVIIYLI
jgi:hypothetical protein